MDDVTLAIGGLRLVITASDPELIRLARRRYDGFIVAGDGEWRLDVDVRADGYPPTEELDVRRLDDTFTVGRQDVRGRIDLRARRAHASLWRADELPLDAFLRVLFSLALVEEGGLLVHAASLVRAGRAYLFPGRSGAGKTTLARLSTDVLLLSDEVSLVRDGRCHGTPFWGELGRGGRPAPRPLPRFTSRSTPITTRHARSARARRSSACFPP